MLIKYIVYPQNYRIKELKQQKIEKKIENPCFYYMSKYDDLVL